MTTDLPNPAQLRAMARPRPTKPCTPGKHCERRERNLGGCIAGECNPPAVPAGVTASVKWCPECRSAGVVGIEQDVCPTCDGTGKVADGVGGTDA